jgi:type IV pilus assembly protein PilO
MQLTLTPRVKAAPGATARATSVPRSQAERLWLIGGGLVAFLIILIGFFLVISPQRSQTSKVDSQVSAARQQNAALQQRIDTLRQQNANLARYQATLATAKLALPAATGMSDFLRSLQGLGSATGTHVTSLTVGQPVDASAALSVAPPAGAAKASASPAAPAPAAGTAPAAASVYSMSITAQVSGSTVALNRFLQQLQEVQPRAVLITQIVETDSAAAAKGAGVAAATVGPTLQLSMQAFVAPAG